MHLREAEFISHMGPKRVSFGQLARDKRCRRGRETSALPDRSQFRLLLRGCLAQSLRLTGDVSTFNIRL